MSVLSDCNKVAQKIMIDCMIQKKMRKKVASLLDNDREPRKIPPCERVAELERLIEA